MPAAKKAAKAARTFESVLERTQDNLRWVIARVPFDAAGTWGKRGQLRVQGEINGFGFRSTLFPDGKGKLHDRQQKDAIGWQDRARFDREVSPLAGLYTACGCPAATGGTAQGTQAIQSPA
ncbi:MAG TPA: DUF1905 domain-containing protein [Candidatus Angelobacter sp.]|nr:DUF1905 domain-containing protein [Candidatus Angelobacter sp.]